MQKSEIMQTIAERLTGDALPAVSAADNGKIAKVVGGVWNAAVLPAELPAVSAGDNGKKLGVSDGAWAAVPAELPAVSAGDNGKVLMVVDGAWAVSALPD